MAKSDNQAASISSPLIGVIENIPSRLFTRFLTIFFPEKRSSFVLYYLSGVQNGDHT